MNGILNDSSDVNNRRLGGLLIPSIFSIAIHNYFGLRKNKEFSATNRMILDSMRTVLVLGAELSFVCEDLDNLQLIGFAVLLLSMCSACIIIFSMHNAHCTSTPEPAQDARSPVQ